MISTKAYGLGEGPGQQKEPEHSASFDQALERLVEQFVAQLVAAHQADMSALRLAWNCEGASMRQEQPRSAATAIRAAERKAADEPIGLEEFCEDLSMSSCISPGDARSCPDVEHTGTSESSKRSHVLNRLLPRRVGSFLFDFSVVSMSGKSSLERFVDGDVLESISCIILLGFCIIMSIEMHSEGVALGCELGYGQYGKSASSSWEVANRFCKVASLVLGTLFSLETLLRMAAKRQSFFRDFWNCVDFALVASWLLEFGWQELRSQMLRPMRIVRFLRLIRMVKYIDSLDSLYFMVRALKSCVKLLGWVSVMLFAVQLLTAFVITELLFSFYFTDSSRPLEKRLEVFKYWGTFPRSLLTTFEMAMANWPVPARVLFENVSEWFVIVSLAHKLLVGFALVGVINAVFTQETFSASATDDLTMVLKKTKQSKNLTAKMDKLFKAADTSSDGVVSKAEFKDILAIKDVQTWLQSMDCEAKDPDMLFDMLDGGGAGQLSAAQFVQGLLRLRGYATAYDLARIENAFRHRCDPSVSHTQESHAFSA